MFVHKLFSIKPHFLLQIQNIMVGKNECHHHI